MANFFKQLIKTKKAINGIPKLVIGINQVDNLGEWDNDINQPTEQTEKLIKERVNDIVSKLTSGNHGATKEQIEYFSALRAYRLPQVINKIIHCTGVITTFKPKEITDPSCSEGMSDENREYINGMLEERRSKMKSSNLDSFMEKLMSELDEKQGKELKKIIDEKKSKPIKVAIIGQSGVGKSTTVNNLFGAKEVVSRTGEGTTTKNFGGYKEYKLDDGSIMKVADLPGYGRGVREDKNYQELYIRTLKDCDVILLVMQANDKAIVDDQTMIECLYEWSKEGLLTNEDSYYGQETGMEIDYKVPEGKTKEIVDTVSVAEEKIKSHNEQVDSYQKKNDMDNIKYIDKIEDICREALSKLDRDSEDYKKIKKIFSIL